MTRLKYFKPWHKQKNQQGFGLVETIIALLVVGLGITVAMNLFLNASKASNTSAQQTIAADAANMLIERMRANSLDGIGGYSFGAGSSDACTAPAKDCINGDDAQNCSPAEIAAKDVYDLTCNPAGILANLPDWEIDSACAATIPGARAACSVTVTWEDISSNEKQSIQFDNIVL